MICESPMLDLDAIRMRETFKEVMESKTAKV
jgi:hypothetical protein